MPQRFPVLLGDLGQSGERDKAHKGLRDAGRSKPRVNVGLIMPSLSFTWNMTVRAGGGEGNHFLAEGTFLWLGGFGDPACRQNRDNRLGYLRVPPCWKNVATAYR